MSIAMQEDRVVSDDAHDHVEASPRPVSEARLRANRANAKRSTGPRTAAGKARSACNAVKHGLCGESRRLPNEDEATYNLFLDELESDLRPRSVLQRLLFPHIAGLLWRMRRLADVEREVFALETEREGAIEEQGSADEERTGTSGNEPDVRPCTLLARRFVQGDANAFARLDRYERGMHNSLARLMRQFEVQGKRFDKRDPREDYDADEPPVPRVKSVRNWAMCPDGARDPRVVQYGHPGAPRPAPSGADFVRQAEELSLAGEYDLQPEPGSDGHDVNDGAASFDDPCVEESDLTSDPNEPIQTQPESSLALLKTPQSLDLPCMPVTKRTQGDTPGAPGPLSIETDTGSPTLSTCMPAGAEGSE